MRQELWQINSILLLTLALTLILNIFLLKNEQVPTIALTTKDLLSNGENGQFLASTIYERDLFDTYEQAPTEEAPSKITPIPTVPMAGEEFAPKLKKPELLEPLSVTLKGILFSEKNENSVALIEDESGKELSYYLNDKIKDGQIIKIGVDKVVVLRSNGQEESLMLKKETFDVAPQEKWEAVVMQTGDFYYEVDPNKLKSKLSSLGQFLEDLSLVSAYHKGTPIGLSVGALKERGVGEALGFQVHDVVISVNDMGLETQEKRFKAFDNVMQMKLGEEIRLQIKRQDVPIELRYRLKTIPKPNLFEFQAQTGLFTMSRDQKRQLKKRTFDKEHSVNKDEMLESIRQKLMESLEDRERNKRVRPGGKGRQ